ncbi:MAG: YegS/Rv2252/BmrU family lipid kinase, partial [Lachnospiraceae bacterium]|nr:YegS/Rv2252/BmrU family lipid kinase [Lachnospiraceae bacterium]
MAKNDMLFIYNPKAGKAQIKNHLVDILDIFVKAGYEVTVYPTQSHGDAIKKTMKKKDKYDIVVCSGGDGTLDEVFTGMMKCEKKVPIGYIPAGSTNDFAMSLNVPKNMVQAAQTVVDGETYAVDVGEFNDDVFAYIAAFGLFTEVSYSTDQQVKNMLGHVAYLLEGVKRLSTIKSYK